jgi:predicted nucleic acid-binding protein
MRISIDTSLLVHASVPSQFTASAAQALADIATQSDAMYGAPGIYAEFPSVLRRFVNQRTLRASRADELLNWFLDLDIEPLVPTRALQERSWAIASRLGQSDTFDAMGYAVAEAIEGEFWTSDRRFANAAAGAGLARVRFVP